MMNTNVDSGTKNALQSCITSDIDCLTSDINAQNDNQDKRNITEKDPESDRIVAKVEVQRFVKEVFMDIGTPPDNAEQVALLFTEADYRGHFSHGLNRLALCVNDAKKGIMDIAATPVILKESPATAWVDGNNGPGAVVGIFCMELAIRKAKEIGVGWVVAKNSNHIGILNWYTNMAMKEGLLGWTFTNASPVVAPFGSKQGVIGTNPMSFSAPGLQDDGFVMDISTSGVAKGKIEMNMKQGKDIPVGWVVSPDGEYLTDSKEAYEKGILMPLGGKELGHKGYSLALMVESLCGILGDANYGPNIRMWHLANEKVANLGLCFACINPEFFAPGFQDRMSNFMDFLRSMEPADANSPVQVPGDWERNNMKNHDELGGIAYKPGILQWADDYAKETGIAPLKSK